MWLCGTVICLFFGICSASLSSLVSSLHKQWLVRDLAIVRHNATELMSRREVALAVSWLSTEQLETMADSPLTVLLMLPQQTIRRLLRQFLSRDATSVRLLVLVPDLDTMLSLVVGLYIPITFQLYAVLVPGVQVYEVYHTMLLHKKEPLPSPAIAHIPAGTIFAVEERQLWRRRNNLQGAHLRVGTREDPPDVIITSNGVEGEFSVTGFTPEFWKEISNILNFTSTYYYSSDITYGDRQSDGSWTGLVGKLVKGELDVCVVGLSTTAARMEVIDFTDTLFRRSSLVYFRKEPSRLSISSIIEVTPDQFLRLLFGIVLLSWFVQFAASRLVDVNREVTATQLLFFSVAAFCQQGVCGSAILRCWSGRLTLIVTSLSGLLVFSMFSATVISRLAIHSTTLPYSDLSQLIANGRYKVGVLRASADIDLLESGYGKVEGWQQARLDDSLLPANEQEGLDRVCQEDLVYITTYRIGHQQYTCSPAFFAVTNMDNQFSIGMIKGLPYLGLFNYYMQRLREAGLLSRLRRRWFPPDSPAETDDVTLELRHVAVMALWIPLGLFFSTVILLMEHCLARRRTPLLIFRR